ncbi:MAG: hypothetical protein OXI88_21180 [Gammaproteobacteria bacterium]|nr:hypothetical protein [Gammaproteobacteria bacterium]
MMRHNRLQGERTGLQENQPEGECWPACFVNGRRAQGGGSRRAAMRRRVGNRRNSTGGVAQQDVPDDPCGQGRQSGRGTA